MGTLQTIHSFAVDRLNNSEITNYFTRFQTLIPQKEDDRPVINSIDLTGPAALGYTDEMLASFSKELDLLIDLVNKSYISDETALLADNDKHRDDLAVYFTSTISQMTNSPIAAQKTAAVSLYNQVKSYVGIYRLADQQETQQIIGLLVDMEKEPNKSNVAVLGLTSVLEELKSTNDEFIRLTDERTAYKLASSTENSKTVRLRMMPLYEDMILLAQSYNIVQPTAETTAFVASLNALIDETKARYNQRIGVVKAKKDKDEPDDRPEIK